ncbi:transposase [Streptomyces sp. NPDC058665]|uniref:IS110 family transposase n=1 Tax=Streptomyces sp. NPDC058665 TaxID=3346586 RepID=UPI0036546003
MVLDAQGERLLSRRVLNDETALMELISDVPALSGETLWTVDINHGGAASLIGLLLNHDQPMVYITGRPWARRRPRIEARARQMRDGFVIADQARMSKDLGLLRSGDETAVDPRTLTARRTDLVNDRTR